MVPLLDMFSCGTSFNLSTRSGAAAYNTLSKPTKEAWDGPVSTFPKFVVGLKLRALEGKWEANHGSGILMINTNNLLTEYHYITDTQITDTKTAQTSDRATQNTSVLSKCLKFSLTVISRQPVYLNQIIFQLMRMEQRLSNAHELHHRFLLPILHDILRSDLKFQSNQVQI